LKNGSNKIKVILLSVVLVLALVPWLFILVRHLSSEDTPQPTPVVVEIIVNTPPQMPTPLPELTPIPIPTRHRDERLNPNQHRNPNL